MRRSEGRMKERRVLSAEEVRRVVPSGDHWALLKWLLSSFWVWDLFVGRRVGGWVSRTSAASLMAVEATLPR